jgi:hypothetical protein
MTQVRIEEGIVLAKGGRRFGKRRSVKAGILDMSDAQLMSYWATLDVWSRTELGLTMNLKGREPKADEIRRRLLLACQGGC